MPKTKVTAKPAKTKTKPEPKGKKIMTKVKVKEPVAKNTSAVGQLEAVYVDVEAIHPNEYNPNRQSDHDFELLCKSIEEDGFTQPIIVQIANNEIVDGEHRWRAMKALGHTKVPVIYTTMSREQQLIATLRHNRARGNENLNMAADVIKELKDSGDLEQAADSLMLDKLDLEIMLDMIPQSDLMMRTPGEILSAEDVEQSLKEEKKVMERKKQEERVMSLKDNDKYTFQMEYPWTEGWLVERLALGRNRNLNKSEQLVYLCEKWKDRLV